METLKIDLTLEAKIEYLESLLKDKESRLIRLLDRVRVLEKDIEKTLKEFTK